jgi:hypothetical protein
MKINNFEFAKKGTKYEVVKVIIMKKLLEKYKDKKYWVEIHPELEYEEGLVSSIYVIDMKEKKEVIYHLSNSDLNVEKGYEKFIKDGGILVKINIKKLSDNIKEIEKEIEEFL